MSRRIAGAVAAVVVVVGVIVLREQTMTRHQPGVPGTATEIVVSASTRNAEPSSTTTELTEALIGMCRMEVVAEPAGPVEQLGLGRFRFVLEPALDEFDARQLHGCLEDARIHHLQVGVERLQPLDAAEATRFVGAKEEGQ